MTGSTSPVGTVSSSATLLVEAVAVSGEVAAVVAVKEAGGTPAVNEMSSITSLLTHNLNLGGDYS